MAESANPPPSMYSGTTCPSCHARLPDPTGLDKPLAFCLYCGAPVGLTTDRTAAQQSTALADTHGWDQRSAVSIVRGHTPEPGEIQFAIGPYQVLSSIGKGGMGEVFLAYDTVCGRRLALKRIRQDLVERQLLHNRFLKEARITSQLMHPAVIPIYSIHASDDMVYYTMPYVEGESLKQILRTARQQEKAGEPLHHIGGSIPALMRIFMTVCQAVSYAHAKGVLHRDLKPENMMIGQYGEVMILDWGLAKLFEGTDEAEERKTSQTEPAPGQRHLTHVGKVVGTITYMAPERAVGSPATVQTDIYALGVTLYQILTLHLPFRRETLKEFRANKDKEVLLEPSEVAPYREVPPILSEICRKCLVPDPAQRYRTMDQLIHDLEIYLEGRAEWLPLAKLDVAVKSDWEFQENVLIAEHVQITRNTALGDWFSLMVSHSSFPQNVRLEARVRMGANSSGLGFLMNIPELPDRKHLIDGYCLWIGSEKFRETKLLRSNVEVMRAADTFLQADTTYRVRIEKVDDNIHFYLDDQLQLTFISHLPLAGTHIGLLSRDMDFSIEDFVVSGGSQSLMVNCLAIPDAFLAHRDYATALTEYRRIAYSFPGRAEGREAMFRAGITLLEQAKQCTDISLTDIYFEQALNEFAKLHTTPGAPLEYLGKALVYQAQSDYEEEIKCFELALRRYPQHPLLRVIEEHIAHRMHESALQNRQATYNFVLLVARHLHSIAKAPNAQKLCDNLKRHWSPLPFLEACPATEPNEQTKCRYTAIPLAFWLAKPYVLLELVEETSHDPIPSSVGLGNALFSLLMLGCWKVVERQCQELSADLPLDTMESLGEMLELIQIPTYAHEHSVSDGVGRFLALNRKTLSDADMRIVTYLMEEALSISSPDLVRMFAQRLNDLQTSQKNLLTLHCYQIWAELQAKEWPAAGKLLHHYSVEQLCDERTPLYFLYGCWLAASEGPDIAQAHFSGLLESPYPGIWALTAYFLSQKIGEEGRWFSQAFLYEKRQLFRQLWLYFHCVGNTQLSEHYFKRARDQWICLSD